MKKIAQTDITGERGVTLVRSIVLSMGCMFYETGGVKAGIDDLIEVRDEETGQVRNMTLQVQVQVKASTRKFPDETDDLQLHADRARSCLLGRRHVGRPADHDTARRRDRDL